MPVEAPVRQPEDFVTIDEALQKPHQTFVNVIGVVEAFWPITSTNGANLQFTITIQDRSVTDNLGQGRKLKTKFFLNHEHEAPNIEARGDTVVLRKFKMMHHSTYGPSLFKNYNSECIVFPSDAMPDPHFNDSYAAGQLLKYTCKPPSAKPPTAEQQMWAISLRHSLSPGQLLSAQPAFGRHTKGPAKKFRLIKDVGPDQFVDLVVEVVKMYPSGQEIYVTDYTENSLLYRYSYPDENLELDVEREGDAYGYIGSFSTRQWPGPFGQMTLQVKLWDPHASLVFKKVKEGDFIELKNVHIKMDRSGVKIEGALHQDRDYPEKISVYTNIPSMQTHEVKRRKDDYRTQLNKRDLRDQTKQRKISKKRKKKKAKAASGHLDDYASESDGNLNPHVKCERPNDQTLFLADIEKNSKRLYRAPNAVDYELPFVNARYKSRVRIVDFWPQDLKDFSRSLEDLDYNDVHTDGATPSSTSYTALSSGTQRWEWHFCLLVEDANRRPGTKDPTRLPLLVFDKDAEYLLCLDAGDLRKDNKRLAELREKLFILWGNLEELKANGHNPLDEDVAKTRSSKAFECCIKETGAKLDIEKAPEEGYQRIFHLYGTTIKA
ncbi:Telomere end binding protein [Macrophomina phaseolina MS6]|uniref:Protection of telomeres protein 1 n=1 Tax=Macrophomina phaseolina (strain MS6) TaxID=1126212 RepID=K2R053_MACPH|nr:Telomere end binding protein [Macrophomina phaseolina MS6]